jgi:peptide deformylase
MYEDLAIIRYPDPRLRKRSEPVSQFDDKLDALGRRMLALMKEAKGVGLAAPQVGINLRLFVMNHTGQPQDDRVIVNPILSLADGEEEDDEGCLSLPNINIPVLRSRTLKLTAQDVNGNKIEETATGYVARIWQHENDHLDGIMLLDRMTPTMKMGFRRQIREMEDAFAKAAKKA